MTIQEILSIALELYKHGNFQSFAQAVDAAKAGLKVAGEP